MTQPIELISLIPVASPSLYWKDRTFIPEAMQKAVEPFLLPYDHPARAKLDDIYTKGEQFEMIGCGKQVIVYSHEALEGYIIKTADMMQKSSTLLRRVEGHQTANKLIEDKNYTHVKATQNWLYPLPGNGNFLTWCVHYVTRPVRLMLEQFNFKCPKLLQFADKILKERFVVVEERIPIEIPTIQQLNDCEIALIDEYIDVALGVGFQDAHNGNFCFDQNGTLVLFDLGQYSKKKESRTALGRNGVDILVSGTIHADYARQKLKALPK